MCHLRLGGILLGEPRKRFCERTEYPDASSRSVRHAKDTLRRVRQMTENLSPHVEFPESERLLVEECAIRIADGRGEGSADEVVRRFRKDVGHLLSGNAVAFVEGCLRAVPSLSTGKRARHHVVAETFPQKILAFADVGDFLDGWDAWLSETARPGPVDLDDWIEETGRCMDGNVLSALRALEPFLPDGYYHGLIGAFDGVRSRLSSLRKEVPERDAVRELLLAGRP